GELAASGIDTVTFNFLYSELGRSSPDPRPRLESCYQAVIDAVASHKKLSDNRLVIGGKSMGGRIASQVAAAWTSGPEAIEASKDKRPFKTPGKQKAARKTETRSVTKVAGLVFLGYALHPPGRPEQLRDKHLEHVSAPMLFVQ